MQDQSITRLSAKNSLTVGITLFSMLFGAGNLILAPMVGAQAGTAATAAMVGFIVSAVGLPILTIAAVAKIGTATDLGNSAVFKSIHSTCLLSHWSFFGNSSYGFYIVSDAFAFAGSCTG